MISLALQSFMEKRNNYIKNQWIHHRKRNDLVSKIRNIIIVEKVHNLKLHKDLQSRIQSNEMCLKRILIYLLIFIQVKIWSIKAQKSYFHQVIRLSLKVVKNSTQVTVSTKITFLIVKNWKNHKKFSKNHKR